MCNRIYLNITCIVMYEEIHLLPVLDRHPTSLPSTKAQHVKGSINICFLGWGKYFCMFYIL